ncbi:hypothetical protein FB107DRAFT_280947 [Schizophyllum commune]
MSQPTFPSPLALPHPLFFHFSSPSVPHNTCFAISITATRPSIPTPHPSSPTPQPSTPLLCVLALALALILRVASPDVPISARCVLKSAPSPPLAHASWALARPS